MKRWTHNEISARYRKLLVSILDCVSEDNIPPAPWDSVIHGFARVWTRISNSYWEEITTERLDKEIVTNIADHL